MRLGGGYEGTVPRDMWDIGCDGMSATDGSRGLCHCRSLAGKGKIMIAWADLLPSAVDTVPDQVAIRNKKRWSITRIQVDEFIPRTESLI